MKKQYIIHSGYVDFDLENVCPCGKYKVIPAQATGIKREGAGVFFPPISRWD